MRHSLISSNKPGLLRRGGCLLLALSLLVPPSLAQAVTGFPVPPPAVSPARFAQEALALFPLGSRRIAIQPFRSFQSFLREVRAYAATPQGRQVGVSAAALLLDSVLRWAGWLTDAPHWAPLIGMVGLNGGDNGDEHTVVQLARSAAREIYGTRSLPIGLSYVDYCERVADQYADFARRSGRSPDPDVVAAIWLMKATDHELRASNPLKLLKHRVRDDLFERIPRLNAAYKVPYNPPAQVFRIRPRAATNQMGQVVQNLTSFDELIAVAARKLVILQYPLQNDATARAQRRTKRMLHREMIQVFSPLLRRLAASSLAEWLRDTSFQAVDPERHSVIQEAINRTLGMDEAETDAHIARVIDALKHVLPPTIAGRLMGGRKRPVAIDRKLEAKPERYPDVASIEDLIRFRIVLDHPGQLSDILMQIGSLPFFAGYTTTYGAPEIKREPGYDAAHVTFVAVVNGKEVAHEFQIFGSPESALRYEFGERASWAYDLAQQTRAFPDFERIETDPTDPALNFQRYKDVAKNWTYFSISKIISDKHTLIPMRIPAVAGRGNVADAAALIGMLKPSTNGAYYYRRTFDADEIGDAQWNRLTYSTKALDQIVRPGEVLGFTESPIATSAELLLREAAAASASSLLTRTILFQMDLDAEKLHDIETLGERVLAGELHRRVGSTGISLPVSLKRPTIGPAEVRWRERSPLVVAAEKTDLGSVRHLLACFALPQLDRVMLEERQKVLAVIVDQVRREGRRRLHDLGFSLENGRVISALTDVVQANGFHLQDPSDALLVLALGLIDPSELARQLRERIATLAQTPEIAPAARPGPRRTPVRERRQDVRLTPELQTFDTAYELRVAIDSNQAGIFGLVTAAARRLGIQIIPGSAAERRSPQAYLRLRLKKNMDLRQMQDAVAKFGETSIPRKPDPRGAMKRFFINVPLSLEPDALDEFIQPLKSAEPTMNITWFSWDEERIGDHSWFALEVAIPESSNDALRSSYLRLIDLLEAQKARTWNGKPLILRYEISRSEVSDKTAGAMLRALDDAVPQGSSGGLKAYLIHLPDFIRRYITRGAAELDELRRFERAIKLAIWIHEGEKRMSHGTPAYITHPLWVAAKLIAQGVRDPVVLIAALLHDSLENGPKNLVFRRYGLKNLPKNDPRLAEAREEIIQRIRNEFPDIAYRLMYTLDYVTDYKTKNYAAYAKRIAVKGGIGLSALKLTDMAHNLESIFDVPNKPGELPFAVDQVGKRVRFGLPIVSWQGELKNAPYVNSRRDFLSVLISQSDRLADEDFMRLLVMENEDVAHAQAEYLRLIDDYFYWLHDNLDCLPRDIRVTQIDRFHSRLRRLRGQLISAQGGPITDPTHLLPSGETRDAAPAQALAEVFVQRQSQSRVAQLFPSFADFMEVKNRHYYEHDARIGEAGDFTTLPVALSPYYGAMVAEQAYRLWQHMRQHGALTDFDTFEILEVGAGTGVLASDILTHALERGRDDPQWQAFYAQLHYSILEQSGQMRHLQFNRLQGFMNQRKLGLRVGDARRVIDEMPARGLKGLVLMNELLDDLGVQKVALSPTGQAEVAFILPSLPRQSIPILRSLPHIDGAIEAILAEQGMIEKDCGLSATGRIYLTSNGWQHLLEAATHLPEAQRIALLKIVRYAETYLPAQIFPEVSQHLAAHAHTYAQVTAQQNRIMTLYAGTRSEHFLASLARILNSGYVLTLDYGHSASLMTELRLAGFSPVHAYGGNGTDTPAAAPALETLGNLTADQDFTLLAEHGRAVGLRPVWYSMIYGLMEGTPYTPETLRELFRPLQKSPVWQVLRNFLEENAGIGRFKMLLQEKDVPGGFEYSTAKPWPPLSPEESPDPETRRRIEDIERQLKNLTDSGSAEGPTFLSGASPLFLLGLTPPWIDTLFWAAMLPSLSMIKDFVTAFWAARPSVRRPPATSEPTFEIDAADPSAYLTNRLFGGTGLEGQFALHIEQATPERFEAELVITLPDKTPFSSTLILSKSAIPDDRGIRSRIDRLRLDIPEGHVEELRPYFAELIRVIVRWLHQDKGFQAAYIAMLYPRSATLVPRLFDQMRKDSSIIPYQLDQPARIVFIDFSLLNLDTSIAFRTFGGWMPFALLFDLAQQTEAVRQTPLDPSALLLGIGVTVVATTIVRWVLEKWQPGSSVAKAIRMAA